MRRSISYLIVTIAGMLFFLLLPLHARQIQRDAETGRKAHMALLSKLQLTDLCLSTEARYTRHPALADRHAPFQEHPLALEHFPSGSLIFPPLKSPEIP
jgi:hypothetical protein